jgi:hypothetical protein
MELYFKLSEINQKIKASFVG